MKASSTVRFDTHTHVSAYRADLTHITEASVLEGPIVCRDWTQRRLLAQLDVAFFLARSMASVMLSEAQSQMVSLGIYCMLSVLASAS